MEELYPPGTQVELINPTTNMLLAGTVMDIPLSTAPSDSPSYQILFDNGTSASISLTYMPSLIPDPPVPMSAPVNPCLKILLLFFRLFSLLTVGSLMNTRAPTIRAFSHANLVGCTISVSRLM
jgi:hypothetical protein